VQTRQEILHAAAHLATTRGLEGLSIGELAQHIGMSKSGLYAHFGSKEELQLATVEEAQAVFEREVARPTLAQPEGLAQVLALCDAYLSYVERRVFPGGCFFAAAQAEFASRNGRVKETIQDFAAAGLQGLAEMIRHAQARKEIDGDADPDQLAFEIDALLHGANASFILFADVAVLERARTGIRSRLGVSRR